MRNLPFVLAVLLIATSGLTAPPPAPYPIPVDSQAEGDLTALTLYQGNQRTIRAQFTSGGTNDDLTDCSAFADWFITRSSGMVTARWSIVSGATGAVDFTWTAADLNTNGGPWYWECGVKDSDGNIVTYKQGQFTLIKSPFASGAGSVTFSTNQDWASIDWSNLPYYLDSLSIVTGAGFSISHGSSHSATINVPASASADITEITNHPSSILTLTAGTGPVPGVGLFTSDVQRAATPLLVALSNTAAAGGGWAGSSNLVTIAAAGFNGSSNQFLKTSILADLSNNVASISGQVDAVELGFYGSSGQFLKVNHLISLSNSVGGWIGSSSVLYAADTALRGSAAAFTVEVASLRGSDAAFTTAVTGLRGADAAFTSAVTALRASDATFTNYVAGLWGADAAFTTDVTALRGSDAAFTGYVAALMASDATFTTDVAALRGSDAAFTVSVASLRGSDAAFTSAVTALRGADAAFTTAFVAAWGADASLSNNLAAASNKAQSFVTSSNQFLKSNSWASADATTNYFKRSGDTVGFAGMTNLGPLVLGNEENSGKLSLWDSGVAALLDFTVVDGWLQMGTKAYFNEDGQVKVDAGMIAMGTNQDTSLDSLSITRWGTKLLWDRASLVTESNANLYGQTSQTYSNFVGGSNNLASRITVLEAAVGASSTNTFDPLWVYNTTNLGTNVSGLYVSGYTGAVGGVTTFTGTTTLLKGHTYKLGLSNTYGTIYGTSVLYVGNATLTASNAGAVYGRTAINVDTTQVRLVMSGPPAATPVITWVYVAEYTNASAYVAGDAYIADDAVIGANFQWNGGGPNASTNIELKTDADVDAGWAGSSSVLYGAKAGWEGSSNLLTTTAVAGSNEAARMTSASNQFARLDGATFTAEAKGVPGMTTNAFMIRDQVYNLFETLSTKTLYGSSSNHPVLTGRATLKRETEPTEYYLVVTNANNSTNLIGTFFLTNTTTAIRSGPYDGVFYASESGVGDSESYIQLVYTEDDGLTTNILATSPRSGVIGASLIRYVLSVPVDTALNVTNCYLGVRYWHVKYGGAASVLRTAIGGTYQADLETPGLDEDTSLGVRGATSLIYRVGGVTYTSAYNTTTRQFSNAPPFISGLGIARGAADGVTTSVDGYASVTYNPTGGVAGVDDVNGVSGSVVLEAGTAITITTNGQALTIEGSAAAGVDDVNGAAGSVVFEVVNMTIETNASTFTLTGQDTVSYLPDLSNSIIALQPTNLETFVAATLTGVAGGSTLTLNDASAPYLEVPTLTNALTIDFAFASANPRSIVVMGEFLSFGPTILTNGAAKAWPFGVTSPTNLFVSTNAGEWSTILFRAPRGTNQHTDVYGLGPK